MNNILNRLKWIDAICEGCTIFFFSFVALFRGARVTWNSPCMIIVRQNGSRFDITIGNIILPLRLLNSVHEFPRSNSWLYSCRNKFDHSKNLYLRISLCLYHPDHPLSSYSMITVTSADVPQEVGGRFIIDLTIEPRTRGKKSNLSDPIFYFPSLPLTTCMATFTPYRNCQFQIMWLARCRVLSRLYICHCIMSPAVFISTNVYWLAFIKLCYSIVIFVTTMQQYFSTLTANIDWFWIIQIKNE